MQYKKLVVFVQHKDVGQLLYGSLTNTSKETNPDWYELAVELIRLGIKVFKYGSEHTGKEAGYQIQEDFNKTIRCIMVASTLACGEGLNLQSCADSVLHERQWNPQNEDQATPGRFKRIGQKSKSINITCVEADETIDMDLSEIVERKRKFFHELMNKGELPKWDEGEIAQELAQRIVDRWKKKGRAVKNANIKKMSKPVRQNENVLGI